MRGHGCRACQHQRLSESMGGGYDKFVEKARIIHDSKYQYHKTNYTTAFQKVRITCPIHGDFEQLPCNHINRSAGCPKCSNAYSPNTIEFVDDLRHLYGDKHDYSTVQYTTAHSPIIVTCRQHGPFEIVATSYKRTGQCPACTVSSQQHEMIELVKSFGVSCVINDRRIISPLELDIYIPDKKYGIEFNGNYFHSYNRPETPTERFRHQHKVQRCADAGIRLIQFNSHEWKSNRPLIESMIKHRLGFSNNRISARRCVIGMLSTAEAKEFFDSSHISGYRPATTTYCLRHNGVVVSAISFSRHAKYDYEIIRFATSLNTVVVGALGKMLKAFIIDNKPSTIMTFADLRYGNGDGYTACGFKLVGSTKPGYIYLDSSCAPVGSRLKYQKHKLSAILTNFSESLSESENMFLNGYRRMWDAGHNIYVYRIS